jgi:hypothetical protein
MVLSNSGIRWRISRHAGKCPAQYRGPKPWYIKAKKLTEYEQKKHKARLAGVCTLCGQVVEKYK